MRGILNAVVWVVLVAGIAAGFLRLTCMRVWTMPGDDSLLALSVLPTLEAGDVLVLLRGGSPSYGELVRCPDPEVPGKYVVGRILGEQGDRVLAEQAGVTVNDKTIRSIHACTPPKLSVHDLRSGEDLELACEIEEAGGTEYTRARAANPLIMGQPYAVTVPEGRVFLASDDRYYHDDSRDFGPLLRDSCNERVVFRFVGVHGWFDQPRRMSVIR
ncbi:MAG TPA: signal peptidase I [Polyangiaceae bacterium]